LLIASHCELPTDTLDIEAIADDYVKVEDRLRDGNDHTILDVNVTFDRYAKVDMKDPLLQGENVYYCGNPGKYTDLLRKGYVSGYLKNGSKPSDKEIVLDLNGWFGDSGSGIFNEKGEVVAVLTALAEDKGEEATLKLMFAYPFEFKQDDIDKVYAGNVFTGMDDITIVVKDHAEVPKPKKAKDTADTDAGTVILHIP